jgi:tRNA nucleotidyltransferase (CCA-adding enzyme)
LGTNHVTADLDFVVEGSAIQFADSVQGRYGGVVNPYPPFGTATWTVDPLAAGAISAPPGHIDFVTARRETYPQPGVLPVVEPSAIEDDLRRRDFTINALAIRLTPGPFGTLIDPFGGERDLHSGQIRVLHDGSFRDDATRIFRAVRFEQRFDFHIAPETLALIPQGLATIPAISGERLYHEIDLILRERLPEHSIKRLNDLGVLAAIHDGLTFDESMACAFKAARWLFETETWQVVQATLEDVYLVLLACKLDDPQAFGQRLLLNHHQIQQINEGHALYLMLDELSHDLRPSEIAFRLRQFGDAALAAGWAIATTYTAREQIGLYVQKLQYLKPTLNGDDLLAMGLSAGPRLGKLLRELWRARYDGEVTTPEEERATIQRLLAEGFGL